MIIGAIKLIHTGTLQVRAMWCSVRLRDLLPLVDLSSLDGTMVSGWTAWRAVTRAAVRWLVPVISTVTGSTM